MNIKNKDSNKEKPKNRKETKEKKDDEEETSLEDNVDKEEPEEQIEIVDLSPELIKEPLATLSERILAGIIDALIVNSMLLASFLLPAILRIIHYFYGLPVLLLLARIGWGVLVPLAVLGMLAYLIFLPAKQERTIGQKKMGLFPMIIEDIQKGELRSFAFNDIWLITKRVLIGSVDILPFTIPALVLINKHPLNQALCDKLTNIVVIAEVEEEEEKKVKQTKDKKEENEEEKPEDELVILK